jgi:glutamine synthetase
VDEYQDFLRCSAASAGNDRRLGANEAPPVIISIYLGDELHAVVDSIIHGSNYTDPEKSIMRIGVDVMPPIPKDTTDRNRTSPLAFTGNKFEFRMMGSSQSVSDPNITLNTIMAEELSRFADILEQAEDFDEALHDLVTKTFTDHQRILFNGNGYSEEWCQEAHRRGLSDLRSTPEAMPKYVSDKNVELVTKHGIFTEAEFRARNEIHLETYRKILNIEAKTTADIAIRQILPAVSRYSADLAARIQVKKGLGCSCEAETDLLTKISAGIDALYDRCRKLSDDLKQIPKDSILAANYFAQTVVPAMDAVRAEADALELLTDKTYWPFPTYSDLLFY